MNFDRARAPWPNLSQFFLLLGFLPACASAPGEASGREDTGTLSLNLQANVDSAAYHLRHAVFQVTGPESFTLDGDASPDLPDLQRTLQRGGYNVALQDGWQLTRSLATGAGEETVDAQLGSENPATFVVVPGQVTPVTFSFFTGNATVRLGSGILDLGINVVNQPLIQAVNTLGLGFYQSCARNAAGSVRCWGDDTFGELGYGNTNTIGDDETPFSAGNVNVGGAVIQIVGGFSHTCALLATHKVRCWGFNGSGQLGYGNTNDIGDNETPSSAGDVDVGGFVQRIGAGIFHTCALLTNGKVRCWGDNFAGALGYGNGSVIIGDNETPATAGDVDVGGKVTQISLGGGHTCALLTGGNVRCWGNNHNGELGYGNTSTIGDDETPASAGDVNVGGTVVQIATGAFHTCALLATGKVRCWGSGAQGQLGYGNTNDIGDDETPASAGDVDVGGQVIEIAAGGDFTCALLATGSVRCWGIGSAGNLGYANTNNIGDDETPASAGDVNIGGGSVVEIAAGGVHACAVLANGAIRCWGSGQYGRLGYGNTNSIGDDETPSTAGDVLVF
jgi:alpha-tubulin suppressor-like RCC1 family protein